MARIFDNIDNDLLTTLRAPMQVSHRSDSCVGYLSRFKFVALTFEKAAAARLQDAGERNASASPDDLLGAQAIDAQGGATCTTRFPAAFMRHDVEELVRFPEEGALWVDVELIKRLLPDRHSVMEFKGEAAVLIAEKMLQFPLLGKRIGGAWNLSLTNEFHMTGDSHLFKTQPQAGGLPLYEGKMIHQFDTEFSEPRYWVNQLESIEELRQTAARRLNLMLRAENLGVSKDEADSGIDSSKIQVDADTYRFGFRDIVASTNERAMICSFAPRHHVAGNTINLQQPWEFVVLGNEWWQKRTMAEHQQLCLHGVLNGFVVDLMLRQKITSHLTMFYVYQVPVPRDDSNQFVDRIISRAARLICTTPEFDDLAKAVGLKPLAGSGTGSSPHRSPLPGGDGTRQKYGTTDPTERAKLRAELDGLVVHVYGLTEAEFAHILGTFPLVPQPVKVAAQNAYRDAERGLIQ